MSSGGDKQTTPPRYRLLAESEMVEAGDEHLNDDAETWSKVPWFSFRTPYVARCMMPVRRAITKDASDG